jgi:hypothetical protein
MSLFDGYGDIVSIHDMMEMLSIGKNKAYELTNGGIIRSFRIENHIKICKNSIIQYVLSQQAVIPDAYAGMQSTTSTTM